MAGWYRLFLTKLSAKGYFDDASRRHRQRRSSKLLMRLRAKALRTRASVDPFRALRRLKATALARLKERQGAPIRLGTVFRRTKTPAVASEPQQLANATEMQELFGHDGPLRWSVIFALGGISKLFMHLGNQTVVEGEEHLRKALEREEGTPLITVSNHVGSIDDPLVTASLVPPSYIIRPESVRWTLCATDRCFGNSMLTQFFRAGKVLPVERGAGLHQLGMRAAECRLNEGDWVHIFPEGTRSRSGELLPPRQGIGKLVANCDRLPLVIPFIHSGMDRVIPPGSVVPKTGNCVRVSVGEPVTFGDVIEMAEAKGWTDAELYRAITHKIGVSMAQLWAELEDQPLPAWATSESVIRWRPIDSRQTLALTPAFSFVQWIREKAQDHMQQAHHRIVDYLDYCRLRRDFVLDSLFAVSH